MLSRILSLLGRTPARVDPPSLPNPPAPSVEPAPPIARTIQPGVTLYDEGQPVRRVCVKKYAAGKSYAWISGPDEYAAVAGQCLIRSFSTISYIMEDSFRRRMREKGVPDDVTEEFLRGARVDDEAYLVDPEWACEPFTASQVRLRGAGGDSYYAISEFQAITATPEPASLALFATGLVGLGAAARRRRNANVM